MMFPCHVKKLWRKETDEWFSGGRGMLLWNGSCASGTTWALRIQNLLIASEWLTQSHRGDWWFASWRRHRRVKTGDGILPDLGCQWNPGLQRGRPTVQSLESVSGSRPSILHPIRLGFLPSGGNALARVTNKFNFIKTNGKFSVFITPGLSTAFDTVAALLFKKGLSLSDFCDITCPGFP
nr:uncharacterized protein LOC123289216 isoform X2 [Equus asinus]